MGERCDLCKKIFVSSNLCSLSEEALTNVVTKVKNKRNEIETRVGESIYIYIIL